MPGATSCSILVPSLFELDTMARLMPAFSKISSAEKGWRMIPAKKGKPAVSHWELVAELGPHSLIRFHPETGRTHQIRVHLASAGFPIAGDDKYGDFELNRHLAKIGLKRMFLHAWRLRLTHPVTSSPLELHAELPGELQNWITVE